MARVVCKLAAVAALVVVVAAGSGPGWAEEPASGERLAVVWTSADPDVADKVCLMYTHAAKAAGWFDEVRLVVWGPSQRLLVGDPALQAKVKAMQESGVVVEACVACANKLGVADQLGALGIDVKPMGVPLSDYLKNGYRVLTF